MKLMLIFLALIGILLPSSFNYVSADWTEYTKAVLDLHKSGAKPDDIFLKSRILSKTKAAKFTCSPLPASESVPTSVHKLRPADIKIVGALGDSLTAANGAKALTVIGLLTEYRGVSWSIGGDSTINSAITLPNILKVYNPKLKGFSVGNGKFTTSGSKFNVAQPGHTSHEMFNQAAELVKRIKSDQSVNFEEDWKLITFFIGGNDLCKFCKDKSKYKADNYLNNIQTTLDYLHENLPRTLVNLVLTLNVAGIRDLSGGLICQTLHNYMCECGIRDQNAAELDFLVYGYQSFTKKLIESGRYDTREDFTVVVQPFMEAMTPPTLSNGEADYSYFAPDCFHFSTKGHEASALELWNNMMQRVGEKSTKWTSYNGELNCPTAQFPYIYTNANSEL